MTANFWTSIFLFLSILWRPCWSQMKVANNNAANKVQMKGPISSDCKDQYLFDMLKRIESFQNGSRQILHYHNDVLRQFYVKQKELVVSVDRLTEAVNKFSERSSWDSRPETSASPAYTARAIQALITEAITTATVPSTASPTNLVLNGKTYYVSYDQPKMNFQAARRFCKSINMALVSVETKQEWNALKPEIDKIIKYFGDSPWSSASDAAEEGEWKWTATGADVKFIVNQSNMADNNQENCMYLHSQDGWGDYSCNALMPFICEQNT